MKKIELNLGNELFRAGIGYEWEKGNKQISAEPVLDIYGNGNGWTKETNGSVVIKGDGTRTVARLVGAGAWKITGNETISD